MSPSIHLTDLCWGTPDGLPIISELTLSFGRQRTGLVGRNGVGKTSLLRLITGDLQPHSGSVSVSGRLAVSHQVIHPRPGQTVAKAFGAKDAFEVLQRVEGGTATVDDLANVDWTLEMRILAALHRLGLAVDPQTPLEKLSGGQRTRVALAATLFMEPDFILLDEPTNNLDREGRRAVIDLLADWHAGAVVISHDRELLETMDAMVELTSLGACRYGGNWSVYQARKEAEMSAAERELSAAERQATLVARNAQVAYERQARRNNFGKKRASKGDAPRVLIGYQKERSQKSSGDGQRLAERRCADAHKAATVAREKIEIINPMKVKLPSSNLAANKQVLRVDQVTVGYHPNQPILCELDFSITGPERIAVVGPNGCGKTTLLALVAGRLSAWRGEVQVWVNLAMLDQSVHLLERSMSIRDNFLRINPKTNDNSCRAALARFRFPSDAALQQVETLSGGQLFRAGLACVLGGLQPPQLLILDEPTNHLDLDSIRAIEEGIRGYDGAVLIVSHDEVFLDAIGVDRRLVLQPPRSH